MSSKKSLSKPLPEKKIGEYLQEDASKEKEYFKRFLWYHGRNLNRKTADIALSGKTLKPGAFLVRDSNSSTGDYVLSVRDDKGKNSPVVEHYKIIKNPDHTLYKLQRSKGDFIHGLENLIEHYSQTAITGIIHTLEKPITCQPPPAESLKSGRTNFLHNAIKSGVESNVCAILKHSKRPNINSKTSEGQPVVHLVIQHGMKDALQTLIDLRFNKANLDVEGFSALHMACVSNQPEMVRMLITQARCDPTAVTLKTQHRCSPLHLAAGKGHLDCVKALIELGAPVRPRDSVGDMPFDHAKRNGRTEVLQFLDNHHEERPAEIDRKDWLQESINRQMAIEMLEKQGCTDGLFLIRKSSQGDMYALSLCYEQSIFHLQIKVIQGVAYYIDDGPFMTSLEKLVDHYSRFRDGLACKLIMGLSADDRLTDIAKHDADDSTELPNSNTEESLAYDEVVTTPLPEIKDKKAKKQQKKSKSDDPLEAMMIKLSNLETGKELGQGEFGTVFRGILHKHVGLLGHQESVAIKTLTDAPSMGDNKEEFLSEARVMCELHHDNIVKLIGICDGPPLMIVQELIKKGSLLDFLWDYPESVNDADVVLWAAQIADGMGYLEQKKFIHRDLAARNLLLASKIKVKISDFGLSRAVSADSDYYQASRGGRWPVKWYAPEAVNYGTFSHASDVWSYGITLYEVYSLGEQPYGDKTGSEVIQMIDNGYRLEKPARCPAHVYTIMKECWSAEPHDRPTFADLLHRFKTQPEFKRVNTVMNKIKRSGKS